MESWILGVSCKVNMKHFGLHLLYFNFYEDSWWHFLLMLGIQARIIPWTITNNIGVDAKRDFSI